MKKQSWVALLVLVSLLVGCGGPGPGTPAPEDALGGGGGEAFDTAPTVLRAVQPVYPELAREEGETGTVILEVLVGADGLPGDVKVVRSQPSFDAAAVEAVRQFVFAPATRGGEPIATTIRIPIDFRLTD
jgi:protein TonB